VPNHPAISRIASRRIDWEVAAQLDSFGCATTGPLLTPDECATTASRYGEDGIYRSRVIMGRHGFGRGEYKYFSYPLPDAIAALRASLYPALADVANRWNAQMGIDQRFPADHAAYLEHCHAAGQAKPTPLLLQYGEADYNCLHQDVYGDLVFPLQSRRVPALAAGRGFHRWRIRAHRAASAHAVTRRGRAAAPGRGVILSGAPPARCRVRRGVYRVNMRHGSVACGRASGIRWGSFSTTRSSSAVADAGLACANSLFCAHG